MSNVACLHYTQLTGERSFIYNRFMDKQKIISKLQGFYQNKKRMPSYSELGLLIGFKSKNAVYKLVLKLADEGYITKDKAGHILPTSLFSEIRKLGFVEAGFPSPAEEELNDTMSLDEFLIRNKEATYSLTIKGNSMKDAGILEGDMVLVEKGTSAKNGDIVIAQVDGEWTIKYFKKNGEKIWLEPANSEFKNIYPKESLTIGAVVKAVIRKY